MGDMDMGRMRALLSSFYGMQDEAEAAESAADIDSAGFDAAAHVREMLQERSVPELVKSSRELISETKGLDSGMQNLVYENYSKFIAATDTIRTMRDRVTAMNAQMNALEESVGRTAQRASDIGDSLHENRAAIEKLVRVRRLLKRLEFLFELPVRLNRSIKLEAYSQAVKYYNIASEVLVKYDLVPSLRAIRVEADSIISGLKATLRARLEDPTARGTVVTDAIRLLVALKEPRSSLRDAFLEWQQLRLRKALQSAIVDTDALTPRDRVARIDEAFIDPFLDASSLYSELFEATEREDGNEAEEAEARKLLEAAARVLFQNYFALAKEALTSQKLSLSAPDPVAAAPADADGSGSPSGGDGADHEGSGRGGGGGGGGGDSGSEGLGDDDAVDTPAATPPPVPSKTQTLLAVATSVADGIKLMLDDVKTVSLRVRGARLSDRAVETAQIVVRQHVECVFSDLREQLTSMFRANAISVAAIVHTKGAKGRGHAVRTGDKLRELAAVAYDEIMGAMQLALSASKPLVEKVTACLPEMAPVFIALVQSSVPHTLQWLASLIEAYGDQQHSTEPKKDQVLVASTEGRRSRRRSSVVTDLSTAKPPALMLVLACTTRHMAESGIDAAVTSLRRALPRLPAASADEYGLDKTAIGVPDLITSMNNAGRTLLQRYVVMQATQLSQMVRKNLETTDWLKVKEPRYEDSRRVMTFLLEDLATMRYVVAATFDEKLVPATSMTSSPAPARRGVRSAQGASSRELDIERLFTRKDVSTGPVEFSVEWTMTGVMRRILKTLVESVRVCTFATNGYKQIQVDAEVMRSSLVHLVDDRKQIEDLLNETVASAAERCLEPDPMQPFVLDSIVTKRLEQIKL